MIGNIKRKFQLFQRMIGIIGIKSNMAVKIVSSSAYQLQFGHTQSNVTAIQNHGSRTNNQLAVTMLKINVGVLVANQNVTS